MNKARGHLARFSVWFLCAVLLSSVAVPIARADSMSVTVTPPLFQLTIGPGESWASALKVVNNNPYDMTYYAQLVDMLPSGEDGQSKFIPLIDENASGAEASTLAHWTHVSSQPIFVKAGSSGDVPFSVDLPKDADPGGHYAAILIGTQPGGLHATGTVLKVSSFVSSLIFVRIKGNVVESGRIREFLTTQQLYQTPKADFLLRFENTGNTHMRPQGYITIYNMWGKERGKVLINQDSDVDFGNVLPHSVRRFAFSWQGDQNPFDIGLYSAVVTLGFGENGKQNASSKTYFWIVPVVPVFVGVLICTLFVLSLVWFIRRYIRRALELEQKRFGVAPVQAHPRVSLVETLIEPVREGVVDLRSMSAAKRNNQSIPQAQTPQESTQTAKQFISKYRLALVFVVTILVGVVGMWLYFDRVLVSKRGFQITDVHIQAENAPQAKIHVEGQ